MNNKIKELVKLIKNYDGINDKSILTQKIVKHFELIKDRSIYFCSEFALRFSSSFSPSFSNTVLSLSNLRKYDDRPFIVCLKRST